MTQFGVTQKIVIVEDNVALNDIYKTRLEMLGYNVFSAYDGLQALSVIEREIPDLVLLDLMVPKKAGDQILEEMRGSDWGKHIKVMIISNLNESEAPAGLRNLGIEGYAVKANLSNDQLDQLVDIILKPAGQVEDVVLSHEIQTTVLHQDHPEDGPRIPSANPFSGTTKITTVTETAQAPIPAPVTPSITNPNPATITNATQEAPDFWPTDPSPTEIVATDTIPNEYHQSTQKPNQEHINPDDKAL
jgi:CheY-like chemotaxis protein